MRRRLGAVALLAALAYVPALTAAPGRMPADSKLYLYLDPGRFLGDAASTFDPRQFAGWVPHQHIAYLWPSGPWFWLFDTIGVPDWIAHRLWIGTIMLAAGLGVRWMARLLGLTSAAALVAAVVYQLSLYVLPYVSRTSVMLLPWAGLGWIVAFTVRATRRGGWGDPAAIALIVLTVGAVNATALAMIVPAPVLFILHEAWRTSIEWRAAAATTARIAVLSVATSTWWIVMLAIQGRHGTDVLPYSESLADVSLTATSPEVWRGLGYWLFYVRDPYAATTTESLRYLASTPAIVISFLVPILGLVGLVWVRWVHRRYAALLVVTGVVLAVGVHPIDERSPLMRLLTGDGEGGLALALRSSTRALPLLGLGLALGTGAALTALQALPWRRGAHPALAASVVVLAVVNVPGLWTGAFVDPALDRDQDPPDAWLGAATALVGSGGRVLQLPGQEFGAYRWGYTVDQPLPGLTEKPLVTRDLLPLGSAAAMDLLVALDDRFQDGTFEPAALAPVSRLLGVDTIWVTNDSAFDRFRTARPEIVADLVERAPGVGSAARFGEPFINRPDVSMTDERAVGDPRVGAPTVPVALHELVEPGAVVRSSAHTVVVSGSGDGLVDAAAAGLLDGRRVVRYSASLDGAALDAALEDGLIVTDSNRDRARHWRSSQDTTGYTEPGGPAADVLRDVAADARLELFGDPLPVAQTTAHQVGAVRARATAYGEPFAYLPEHRPAMAVDGDVATGWIVGEHGDPIGETIRIDAIEPLPAALSLRQPDSLDGRHIARVTINVDDGASSFTVDLDGRSLVDPGQPVALPAGASSVEITIDAVRGGTPGTGGGVAGVGFAELGVGPSVEVVRPPHDALAAVAIETPIAIVLSRLRVDPMDRWRDDPEPRLIRELELPVTRTFAVEATVRVDARAGDDVLAALLGWPVRASTRLTGSIRSAGAAAFDGDSETAWTTAFGAALGAQVTVDGVAAPVRSISVRQPIAGFSRVTRVTASSGGESRDVALETAADGTARAVVEPPLPPGSVTVAISEIDPATTIDRRFADVVELPAAISEIGLDGAPRTDLNPTITLDCTVVAEVDGRPLAVRLTGDDWSHGEPLLANTCDPDLELGAGAHRIVSRAGAGLTLDRLVLRSGFEPSAPPDAVEVTTVHRSRTSRTVDVEGCPDGCWLVLGEGYSTAWSATIDGRTLGEPVLVDGGFNGWRLPPEPGRIELRWTAQRPLDVAFVVTIVAIVAAVALVVVGRRRAVPAPAAPPPRWMGPADRRRERRGLVAAVWVLGAALLIGPSWALWGLLAGGAALATGWRRFAELTALATVVAVGGAVAIIERRESPFPNGGWPATFDWLHGIGMFAVVALLAGVVAADDAVGPADPADRINDVDDLDGPGR